MGLMAELMIFGISVALSFAAWGAVCYRYIWPFIRSRSLPDAAAPLLYINVFRFVGASFLVPGVAGSLPRSFAVAGAFGDLFAVILAWVALMLLRKRAGYAALWIFNLWGAADLLLAFYQGLFDANFFPSALGATFYIPTVYVPLLLCVHLMLFVLLLRASRRRLLRPSEK
jgi:hypothetical protein